MVQGNIESSGHWSKEECNGSSKGNKSVQAQSGYIACILVQCKYGGPYYDLVHCLYSCTVYVILGDNTNSARFGVIYHKFTDRTRSLLWRQGSIMPKIAVQVDISLWESLTCNSLTV